MSQVTNKIMVKHNKNSTLKVMPLLSRKNFSLLLVSIISFLTIGLLTTSPALAHSSVLSTYPSDGEVLMSPPDKIEMAFNENITMSANGITLFDSSGEPVPVSTPIIEPDGKAFIATVEPLNELPTSWYAVSWRAISQDGHPIQGSFTFNAGATEQVYDPDAGVSDPTAIYRDLGNILRTLGYIALILTIGFFAAIYVLNPSKEAVSFSTKLALGSIGLGLIVTPLIIVNNALILNGGTFDDYQPAFMIALQSSTGTSLLLRIAAYFGLATAVLLSSEKGMRIVSAVIGFAAAAALAVSYAISGHANSVDPVNLASISIVAHVLAGGIWLGGIPALAYSFRKKTKLSNLQLVAVADRFSIAATVSVLIVLIFGVTASLTMFEEFEDIFTEYGYIILLKFALVSVLALLGAYNHFIVLPSLRKEINDSQVSQDSTSELAGVSTFEENNDSNTLLEETNPLSSTESQDLEDGFSFTVKNPIAHLRNILKIEALAFVLVALVTGWLTAWPAPAAAGSHAAHLGLEHSHSSSLDPGVLAALAELEPKITQNSFGAGEVQVNYRPGRTDRENEIVLFFYDESGNEINAENIEVAFTHPETGIGPIERQITTIDGRNVLNTRDLGIQGKWVMSIKARTGGLSAAATEVTLEIKAPVTSENLNSSN